MIRSLSFVGFCFEGVAIGFDVSRSRGSCGSCGEVAGTKVKGSRLNYYKACALMLERLSIDRIRVKVIYERERQAYKRNRDNVWWNNWNGIQCRYKIGLFFIKLQIRTLDSNFEAQGSSPNELTSLIDKLFDFLLSLPFLSSLHCLLFICAPMHTMHVRVQDMHAMHVMHDRHLAYMHYMWCMLDHSLIWALMYENASWISTMMKV